MPQITFEVVHKRVEQHAETWEPSTQLSRCPLCDAPKSVWRNVKEDGDWHICLACEASFTFEVHQIAGNGERHEVRLAALRELEAKTGAGNVGA